MKSNFSPNMKKVIQEMLGESKKEVVLMKEFEVRKIKRKPTKKKVFVFKITKIKGDPFIEFFINNRFYTVLFREDGKWKEEN